MFQYLSYGYVMALAFGVPLPLPVAHFVARFLVDVLVAGGVLGRRLGWQPGGGEANGAVAAAGGVDEADHLLHVLDMGVVGADEARGLGGDLLARGVDSGRVGGSARLEDVDEIGIDGRVQGGAEGGDPGMCVEVGRGGDLEGRADEEARVHEPGWPKGASLSLF